MSFEKSVRFYFCRKLFKSVLLTAYSIVFGVTSTRKIVLIVIKTNTTICFEDLIAIGKKAIDVDFVANMIMFAIMKWHKGHIGEGYKE